MEEQLEERMMREASRESSKREMIFEALKPYIYCIFCNCLIAGYNIVSKVSLNDGMSRYALVVYGHAIGALTTAVLAFLFERNNKSKMSKPVLRDIFFLGLLGTVLGRTLFFAGLENTSPAFAAAMGNLIPAITFVLAVLCRMEKLEIFRYSAQAKIVGSLVAFGGAVLMTLYKGIALVSLHGYNSHHHENKKVFFDGDWIKGSIFLFISFLALAVFYILQTSTIKKYPAPITLTSYTCLSGTLLAAILTAIIDHKASTWRLSWNIALLGPVYGGAMIYGMTIYIQLLVVRKRGPVFTTAFRPLSTIIAAIMGLLILGDGIHLGGVLGATLIVIGLYALLWGKEKEKENKVLEPMKSNQAIEMKSEQAIEIKSEK